MLAPRLSATQIATLRGSPSEGPTTTIGDRRLWGSSNGVVTLPPSVGRREAEQRSILITGTRTPEQIEKPSELHLGCFTGTVSHSKSSSEVRLLALGLEWHTTDTRILMIGGLVYCYQGLGQPLTGPVVFRPVPTC